MDIFRLISIFFIILIIVKVLECIGKFFSNLIKIKLSFNSEVIFGFSILNIFFYFLYFFLKIDNFFILLLFIPLSLIFVLRNPGLRENKYDYFFLFLICFVYLIPAFIFKEQFYVFRGNYWDYFNYLSSASLFNKYNYLEILNNKFDIIYLSFQNIDKIVQYRPITNFVLSLFLNFKYLDIFLISYAFKIFCICLVFLSFKELITNLKITEKKKYLISTIFIFSFWVIFIFEIEALSHLASISVFLICLKYLGLFFESLKNKKKNYLIFYVINLAALFIIYPEIFLIFLFLSLIYLIDNKSNFNFNKTTWSNIFFSLILFLFLVSQSYRTNFEFVMIQINQALDSSINWWGYYGAYILGRDNLVMDDDIVNLIKHNLGVNLVEKLEFIYSIHYENNYKFIYLNLLPSLFGLYHITIGKILNSLDYLFLILTLLLNIYLIKIVIQNFSIIKKYKLYIFSFIVLFIFLILNKNFWTVIKIYSYLFPFLFIFFSISFNYNKLNKLYLVLLFSFIFYKYSIFNYGIGKLDSFPSIINKTYKENVVWSINEEKIKKCKNVNINISEYFKKSYVILKLKHQNIEINSKNTNSFFCEINFKNKMFKIDTNE